MNGMLGDRPITTDELEKTLQQQIFELPGSHETMNSVGSLFSDLLQMGLPLNFYEHYVSRVSSLTIPDLQAAARTLLDPTQTVWMVVADRAEVEPALRALNIGPIVPVTL
jgi:zinc protease